MGPLARGDFSTISKDVDELSRMPLLYGLIVMDDTVKLDSNITKDAHRVHICKANLINRISIKDHIYGKLERLVRATLETPFEDSPGSERLIEGIHDKIFSYRPEQRTDIESNQELREAIELYESLTGVNMSTLG